MKAYEIYCPLTGKKYIGITLGSVEARWKKHVNDAMFRHATKNSKP